MAGVLQVLVLGVLGHLETRQVPLPVKAIMGVLVVMQVRLLVVLVVEVVQPQMEGMQRVLVLVLAVLVN